MWFWPRRRRRVLSCSLAAIRAGTGADRPADRQCRGGPRSYSGEADAATRRRTSRRRHRDRSRCKPARPCGKYRCPKRLVRRSEQHVDKTDAQGRMTATFGLGSDRANRDVTITAKSGAVSVRSASLYGDDAHADRLAADRRRCDDAGRNFASVADAAKAPAWRRRRQLCHERRDVVFGRCDDQRVGRCQGQSDRSHGGRHCRTQPARMQPGQADVKAGSTAVPAPEPAGVVIKDLTIQVNPSVIAPNTGRAESSFSQLDVRVTGDLGTACWHPGCQRAGAVPHRFDAGVRQAERRYDCGSGPEQCGRLGYRALHRRGRHDGTDQIVICASVDGCATAAERRRRAPVQRQREGGQADDLATSRCSSVSRPTTRSPRPTTALTDEKLFSIYVTNAAAKGVSGATVSVRSAAAFYLLQGKHGLRAQGGLHGPPVASARTRTLNFNGVLDSGDNNQNRRRQVSGRASRRRSRSTTMGVTDSYRVRRAAGAARPALRLLGGVSDRGAQRLTAGSERSTTLQLRCRAAEADVTSTSTPGFRLSPFGRRTCVRDHELTDACSQIKGRRSAALVFCVVPSATLQSWIRVLRSS